MPNLETSISNISLPSFSEPFQRLLHSRGFDTPEKIYTYLFPKIDDFHSPEDMKGMVPAKDIILQAIAQNKKILIHGDYDVDGMTASAIMSKTLESLEGNFKVFLPDRERDGYGVSSRAIQEGADSGYGLLITVDCGVAALKEIALAKKLGMQVIIIDHHRLSPEGLPNADAILNPQQIDCHYPCPELSAAGIAFKLSQSLLGEKSHSLLDLAALSTISDVAPLRGENRLIVREGLEVLSDRKNAGIKALSEVAKIKTRKMSVVHIGFQLAPRLNAAGRMGSPDTALRLLVTESEDEAKSLARVLDAENKLRQEIERKVLREAKRQVEQEFHFNRDKVIVVSSPNWHVGVIGIIAARLLEKYGRPAVVIGFQGEEGRASGRSMKGFHLFKAFEACSDCLVAHGGHELAAGLSIEEDKIDLFREKINDYARENLDPKALDVKPKEDLELSLDAFGGEFIRELELLEPHGYGNSKPTFKTDRIRLKSQPKKLYSNCHEVLISDGKGSLPARLDDDQIAEIMSLGIDKEYRIWYRVQKNHWNGMETIYLKLKAIESTS